MPIAVSNINAAPMTTMKNLTLESQGIATSKDKQHGFSFSDVFQQQIDNVNAAHKEVERLQERFVLGDENISLAEVKVAEMKATIYTKALTHVTSKAISAYHELMNMSI
jgi:flagellar hook-basal body complex protein FliE